MSLHGEQHDFMRRKSLIRLSLTRTRLLAAEPVWRAAKQIGSPNTHTHPYSSLMHMYSRPCLLQREQRGCRKVNRTVKDWQGQQRVWWFILWKWKCVSRLRSNKTFFPVTSFMPKVVHIEECNIAWKCDAYKCVVHTVQFVYWKWDETLDYNSLSISSHLHQLIRVWIQFSFCCDEGGWRWHEC